ncbi:hypothetical protein LPB73_07325 [Tardiphaga sp. 37S4]|uniref:hypothetical protein n=1 Tax=Tardiphaga sp. 37S4 TaxID=1404741 RepID=UPI001E336329|nr:hypothetical protein [Tardiphaga sp. 37S4]UFS77179.1 hypothetical protein LPB73_07325 [Tardiphaga sp. 37S4]
MSGFKPSDLARAALHEMHGDLADTALKKFFEMWEAEVEDLEAPRKAGSVIAHAYMGVAARFAILGCEYSDTKPSLEVWMAFAKEEFESAIRMWESADPSPEVPATEGRSDG